MDELIVSREEIEKWTEKLKKLLDVSSEKRVAEELEMSPSQFSQMKSNGKFHYGKFIALMKKKNFSLDDFFNIKDESSNEYTIKSKIPYFGDAKKYILLQDIDNSNDELRVIKRNEKFIIFNTTVNEFITDGIYVFMQSDFIIVRRIRVNINTEDIQKLELIFSDINNEQESKIGVENLDKINFVGKVEYIIEKKIIK